LHWRWRRDWRRDCLGAAAIDDHYPDAEQHRENYQQR